jgi:serine/threonine-protein kinase HipA
VSAKHLGVWLNGVKVARLEAKKPWDVRCRYEPGVLAEGEANRPLLSCSLPVIRQSQDATPWVRGLLPEGNHLLALASMARVPTNYYADLLARYGRDIAGAFTIGTEPPEPRQWSLDPYSDDELVEELQLVLDAPGFAVRDDSELSIAGLQNKLLVTSLPDGKWARPCNGHPSTHIMKLADGRDAGLLAAEHACMQLARMVGLTTVATDLVMFNNMEVLIVERYDRRINPLSGTIERLHQEDACQALGIDIDSNQGRGKYERFGGPTFVQIAGLLDRFGDSAVDHRNLLRAMVFTSVIGNADAHGKNVSFLIDTDTGAITLAPLYDTVPTALWPRLRTALAMSVDAQFDLPSVEQFLREATRWGMGSSQAEQVVSEFIAELRNAIALSTHTAVTALVMSRLDRIES